MTHGQPNTSEPTALDACRQVARYLAQNSSAAAYGLDDGVRFCEADESDAANLYACVMPPRDVRRAVAMSVTAGGTQPGGETDNPTRRIIIELTARAGTIPDAVAAVEEARRLLYPGGFAFLMPPFVTGGAFEMRGVIGYPPPGDIGEDGIDVWRLIGTEIVSDVQPVAFEAGPAATEEGEAEAVLTIAARVARAVMPQPGPALRIWHDATGGVLSATAEVAGELGRARTLRLRRETAADVFAEQTIDLSGLADLDALAAAVTALGTGWATDTGPGGWTDFGERDARDLAIAPRAAALGTGSKVTLYVLM